ncbi:winged helix-turn-helix transcriptional regulator [Actinomadura napierensis]|uniref:HTH hxlR-type domain-containing protein n=1 Tax=Actinomadura napierensis TaxID=267854 RepID=A0ABN2ZDX4_9ACTN
MLTLTTKRLCRDGLVERTVYPTIPPRTDYRLTAMGRGFSDAVRALADWSRDHRDALGDARAHWDADHPDAADLGGTAG